MHSTLDIKQRQQKQNRKTICFTQMHKAHTRCQRCYHKKCVRQKSVWLNNWTTLSQHSRAVNWHWAFWDKTLLHAANWKMLSIPDIKFHCYFKDKTKTNSGPPLKQWGHGWLTSTLELHYIYSKKLKIALPMGKKKAKIMVNWGCFFLTSWNCLNWMCKVIWIDFH